MPPIYTRGTNQPTIEWQRFRSDPTRGIVAVTGYSGIGIQQMEDLANQYAFNGVAYDLMIEKGVARLEVNDATMDNPIDNWEILGNVERKDLFQNPLWGNLISDGQMALILQHLENNDPPSTAFAIGQTPDMSTLANTVVQRAYARYQAGNQEFENDAYGGGYVLKHTTNVSNRWTQNIADFNVGRIYSTAQLLSEVSSTQLWTFPIPNRLYYKINSIPVPTLREYFRWGWKKSRSDEDTTANNRVNITTHYVLEQWSTDDYLTAE